MALQVISPPEADKLLKAGNAVLVDIRETSEYADEYILGAHLEPLSVFPYLTREPKPDETVIFMCQSGRRTSEFNSMLQSAGYAHALVLEGGMEGWKSAGLPISHGHAPLELERIGFAVWGVIALFCFAFAEDTPVLRWGILATALMLLLSALFKINLLAKSVSFLSLRSKNGG